MKAQIIGLQLNIRETFGNGKSYDGHKITYKPEPYKGKDKDPTEKFLFGNSDVAKKLLSSGVQVGDWAELKFEKNGKYSNLVDITVSSPPAANSQPVSSSGGGRAASSDTDERIARAVAIKEAGALVATLAQAGGYTAANLKKREFMVEQILQTAREFLPFLKNTESVDAVVGADIDGEDVDQVPFED